MASDYDRREYELAEHAAAGAFPARAAGTPGKRTLTQSMARPVSLDGLAERIAGHIQRKASGGPAQAEDPHAVAAHGIAGPAELLPHSAAIQAAFGHHDVNGIRAHVGGAAAEAGESLGARAYATGHDVAFASAPDLHTAAHEAAHVVQQRAGVHLKGGVGEAGDPYERHADEVADRVVRGESAEDLLDGTAGGGATSGVQGRWLQLAGEKAPSKLGGDLSASGNKVTASVSVTYKPPPTKLSSIKAEVQCSVSASGSVTMEGPEVVKDAMPGGVSTKSGSEIPGAGDKSGKPNPGIADEVALKLVHKLWDSDLMEKSSLAGPPELEFGASGSRAKGGEQTDGSASIGIGIKFKFKGGESVSGKLTLLKVGGAKAEDGELPLPFSVDVLVGSLSLNVPCKVGEEMIGGAKVSADLGLGVNITIKPDKMELAKEALKKFAPQILQRLGLSAFEAVRGILASGPALIGILGGYIQIKALIASLEDAAEMKQIARDAENGAAGYASGFVTGLGGTRAVSGTGLAGMAWMMDGIQAGAAAKVGVIQRIMGEPTIQAIFAGYGISIDDVIPEVEAMIEQRAGEIYDVAYRRAEPAIAAQYYHKWRKSRSFADEHLGGNVERHDRELRAMLGLPAEGDIPDGGIPPAGL